jgi:metallo-beta-lactamase family protein
MAENTLGRRLVESKDDPNAIVRIFGDEFKVKAKIVVLNSFSAHADRNELLDYFSKYDKSQLENIFLVHGDYDQQTAFQDGLTNNGFNNITIPQKGFEIQI